jgi:mono/diheme cytochrome c family protein
MFTQTTSAPPVPEGDKRFEMTDTMKNLTIPKATKYDVGRQQFLLQCSHCHGLAGDGKGWAGDYLHPAPASLQASLAPTVPNIMDHYDGTTLAKLTNGIHNSAMPTWGEFMTIRMRWADVKFLKESFTTGPKTPQTSHYGKGDVPLTYVRTDRGIFESEIATIDPANGKLLYAKYCLTCHGADGKGGGPGVANLAGGGPVALPPAMNQPYIFSAIRGGIPDTMMYGFRPLLTETEIWDLTAYTVQLTGGKW